jgi:hypothetical protein
LRQNSLGSIELQPSVKTQIWTVALEIQTKQLRQRRRRPAIETLAVPKSIVFIAIKGAIRRECPDRMSRKTNLQGETKSNFLALGYKNVNFIGSGNGSKKYFKTITLDDHELLSFVDLGSQCSLITESLARKLNIELAPLKVPVLLSTLGDFIIKPKFSVVVRMVVDGISKMVEFYVIQKCVMNVDVLIGHKFTELEDIQYTKAGNSLKFIQSNQHKSINSVETTLVNVGVDKPEVVHKVLDLLNDYSTCLASKLVEVGKANTKPMKIEGLHDLRKDVDRPPPAPVLAVAVIGQVPTPQSTKKRRDVN